MTAAPGLTFCQVTVVSANHGVAAASCFDYHADGQFSGVYTFAIAQCEYDRAHQEVNVKNVYKHPRYDSTSYANNIAIVEFDAPLDSTWNPMTVSYNPPKWSPEFSFNFWAPAENNGFLRSQWVKSTVMDQNTCAEMSTIFADNQRDYVCSDRYVSSYYGEGCIMPYQTVNGVNGDTQVSLGFYSHSYVLNDLNGYYCKGHEGMLHYYILIANYIPWIKSVVGDIAVEGDGNEPTDKNYVMKTNEQISSVNAEPFTWYMWDKKVPRPYQPADVQQEQPQQEQPQQPQQPQPQPAQDTNQTNGQPKEQPQGQVADEPAQTSTSTQTTTKTNTITEEGDVITETFTTAYINQVQEKETVDVVTTIQTTDIAMDTVTETSTVTEQSTETESSTLTETLMLTQTMSTTDDLTTTQVSQSMCPTVEQCVPETSVNQVTVMETFVGDIVTETTSVVSTILPSFVPGADPTGPYKVTVTVPGMADKYTETTTATETSLVSASGASTVTITAQETTVELVANAESSQEPAESEPDSSESPEEEEEEDDSNDDKKSSGLPTGAIVALVILAVLILATIIGICIRRYRRKRREEGTIRPPPEETTPYYNPPHF